MREKVLDVYDENFEFQGAIGIKDFSFTRFEVYGEDTRCILLTNPIYFAKRRLPELPQHKVAQSAELKG